jgi:hypothetical protein
MPSSEPKRVTVAKAKRQAACVVSFEARACLVGLLGFAALLLLLAALCGYAASLHLVDDEAGVALLAVPLEAFEVRVGKLVVRLGRVLVRRHSKSANAGGETTHLLLVLLVDGV